jgi:hypothetical protein
MLPPRVFNISQLLHDGHELEPNSLMNIQHVRRYITYIHTYTLMHMNIRMFLVLYVGVRRFYYYYS